MDAGRRLEADRPWAEEDVAAERVERKEKHQRDDDKTEQESEQTRQTWQREDVESDVAGKYWVS